MLGKLTKELPSDRPVGFSDSILQMWAAFLYELTRGRPVKRFAGCVTPDEAALSHRLFTAALESQRAVATVPVEA